MDVKNNLKNIQIISGPKSIVGSIKKYTNDFKSAFNTAFYDIADTLANIIQMTNLRVMSINFSFSTALERELLPNVSGMKY